MEAKKKKSNKHREKSWVEGERQCGEREDRDRIEKEMNKKVMI